MNQWASVKRPRTKEAQEGFQNWSAKSRFDSWFLKSDRKYLWIQDETLNQEGGSLLISDIIEDFADHHRRGKVTQNIDGARPQSGSALAYFCCQQHKGQQWTPSQVLGGLIHMLIKDRSELRQTTRETYDQRLKASLVDDSRFLVLVEILLDVLRSDILSSLPRIALMVERIDQCGADAQDIGLPDLLDVMEQCVVQVPNLKWVISSQTNSESSHRC